MVAGSKALEAPVTVVERRVLSYADVAKGPPAAAVNSGDQTTGLPEEVGERAACPPMEGEPGPSPLDAVGEEGTSSLSERSVPDNLMAEGEAEGSGMESEGPEVEGMEVGQPSLKRKMEGADGPTSSQDIGSFPDSPGHLKQWSTRTPHKHHHM